MVNKPLLTMKIEVLEAQAVVNFIDGVNLKLLKNKDVIEINKALVKKLLEIDEEMQMRRIGVWEESKKADQDGNPNQQ